MIPFHKAFAKVVAQTVSDEATAVRTLRGNKHARILVLAPAPTEEEIQYNSPLSDGGYARKFHEILALHGKVSTEDDCLVMCGSPFNEKPRKASFEPFRKLVQQYSSEFKIIVCIGGTNFKFLFGDGKNPSMQTLAGGELVYMPEDLGNTPLFIFPEIHFLAPKFTNDKDQDWKLALDQEKCIKWVSKLSLKFATKRKIWCDS